MTVEDSAYFDRLLAHLKVERRDPALPYLSALIRAYAERIPFDSIAKILRAKAGDLRIVTLAEYVQDAEEFGLGGTCFANNSYFAQLLRYLGFDAENVPAGSEEGHDTHLACRVNLDGRSYIVDFGNMWHFAGPFLLGAGPPQEAVRGSERMVFIPSGGNTFKMEFYRDGKIIRQLYGREKACDFSDMRAQIESTLKPDSYFMGILCVCKHAGEETAGIWNKTFFRHTGLKSEKREISNPNEMKEIFTRELGMPHFPLERVLDKMSVYAGVKLF